MWFETCREDDLLWVNVNVLKLSDLHYSYPVIFVLAVEFSGIFIINVGKTWEKLELAALVIVSIENPQDIIVQSARPYGQRAVLKFAQYTGAQAIAGRHTPGTFTNQLQTTFCEPRLLILTDPRTDHQVTIGYNDYIGQRTFGMFTRIP